jgi:hypothetical protein
MLQLDNHFAIHDLHAASQPIFLRVLVPLIEHIQLFIGWRGEIFHARRDIDGTGSAGAIETSRLHLHASFLSSIEQKGIGRNFGGLAAGQKRYFGHNGGRV